MIGRTVYANTTGRTARIFRSYENKNCMNYFLVVLYTCLNIVRIGLCATCIYFAAYLVELKDIRPSYGVAEILYTFLRNYGFTSFTDVFSRLAAPGFVVGVVGLVCSVILPVILGLLLAGNEKLKKHYKTFLITFISLEIVATIAIILAGVLVQQHAEKALLYIIQSPIIGNLTAQFCSYSPGTYSTINGHNVYYTTWLSTMLGGNYLNSAYYEAFVTGLIRLNVNPTMEAVWWCKVVVFFSNSSYFTYITIICTGVFFALCMVGVIVCMLTKKK